MGCLFVLVIRDIFGTLGTTTTVDKGFWQYICERRRRLMNTSMIGLDADVISLQDYLYCRTIRGRISSKVNPRSQLGVKGGWRRLEASFKGEMIAFRVREPGPPIFKLY
ncbi:hypothetical protein LENED_004936 [Lentinula edodes]|uniref:Uncharacterized protein n=1 Tax=Lentinula edodes TaxID=5353 RepID=A0A1Q3E845_LENED|nr:hypothetical protein LENED_004936 [Lentinula edodes]